MDMDGNIVRRMKGTDGCLTINPNLNDLACYADLSPNPQVIDLATGDMFFTRSKLQEHLDEIFCLPWYSFGFGRTALSRLYKLVRVTELPPFVHGITEQICYVLTVGDGAGWRRTRPPHNSSHSWLSPDHRHYRRCYVLLGVPQ
jgi:hypothetical protein